MKRAMFWFALLGLIGCFLPLIPGASLFDLRDLGGSEVWLVLGAFAVAGVVGLADPHPAGSTIALVCFGYVAAQLGVRATFELLWHASIGGKLIAVATVGGFASALASFAAKSRHG